jgi:SRSO17 transposase
LFKANRRGNDRVFGQYLEGLFHEGKHNIERMSERIKGSKYDQLHHFISESPWAHEPVLAAVGKDISNLFSRRSELVGLIIDESGHRKSGDKSVGVGRQYLGSIGKTDNGQVAVFVALAQGDDVGMVDVKLYLPKSWTQNKKRCEKAGIPAGKQTFKTKPQLALEMIQNLEGVVDYDWVGGDGVYGDSTEVRKGIAALGRKYVLDVHEKQTVYLEHPSPYIPDGPTGQGGKKNTYKTDKQPVKVKDLLATLPDAQWNTYTFRLGTKGGKTRQVVCLDAYIWNKHRAKTDEVEKVRLIISREVDGSEIKYSVTNDVAMDGYIPWSEERLLYRQMQRYWVERAIQDCKDTLGMTDYQVRSWRAWHHHITLTIMALHYMLEQKVEHEEKVPLLSCPDIKFFLAMNLMRKATSEQEAWDLIQKRHFLRQKDLDRYHFKVPK